MANIKIKEPRIFGPIGQEIGSNRNSRSNFNRCSSLVGVTEGIHSPSKNMDHIEPVSALPADTEYQSVGSPAPVHRTKIYGKFNIKELVNPVENVTVQN